MENVRQPGRLENLFYKILFVAIIISLLILGMREHNKESVLKRVNNYYNTDQDGDGEF